MNANQQRYGNFVKSGQGVAVQSTFKRLTQCFSLEAKEEVYIGKVSYIDYSTDWIPEGNVLNAFLCKRKSFEHEQELRAVIMQMPTMAADDKVSFDEFDSTGEYIDVNLDILIENIYVSPTAQDWFLDLVASVMKRYNLEKRLVRSDLARDPVY